MSNAYFGTEKFFLCYYPATTTESTQVIDAGLGRSVRCTVGQLLDKWLMDDENILKWEDK